MQEKYLRPGFDFALAHAIEEAGEFLAAAGKTQRWGRLSSNPELPPHERENKARYTGPIEVGMEFTGFGPVRVINTGHYPASSGDPAVLVQALDKSYTGAPEWWMPEAYFRMKALPRAAGENVQEAA